MIQFTVKRTTKHDKDDFKLDIAHNEYLSEESSGISVMNKVGVKKKDGRGGSIW